MPTMNEVDVQNDLKAVTDQLTKLVEELNKVNTTRDNLVTQIQNLNGVAMYLRGKVSPEEQPVIEEASVIEPVKVEDELERSTEYPVNTA